MLSHHARARIAERVSDPSIVSAIAARLDRFASRNPTGSIAYRVGRVDGAMVGRAWSDESNGNTLWAIVRNGTVETCMWRRDTQPATRAAFRVDNIA